MSETDLQEKLAQIAEAMKHADPKKQEAALSALIDPADETACEGCQ